MATIGGSWVSRSAFEATSFRASASLRAVSVGSPNLNGSFPSSSVTANIRAPAAIFLDSSVEGIVFEGIHATIGAKAAQL
jgi:hypothetical protein